MQRRHLPLLAAVGALAALLALAGCAAALGPEQAAAGSQPGPLEQTVPGVTETPAATPTDDDGGAPTATATPEGTPQSDATATPVITPTATPVLEPTAPPAVTPTAELTIVLPVTPTEPLTAAVPFTQGVALTGVAAASAQLLDAAGQPVGEAFFTPAADGGVIISVTLIGLTVDEAGEHGIHVHQVGACTPDFSAAGGHFNPLHRQHGLENPAGAHAGDLPNIEIAADGTAEYSAATTFLSLSAGPAFPFDADGSALVIHAGADDQASNPSGGSGAAIACGVIVALAEPAVPAAGAPPTVVGHVVAPQQWAATPELVAGLELPPGFTITVVAQALGNIRMMAQAEDGSLYLTRREQGDVIRLVDADGDGAADGPPETVAADLPYVHGIALREGRLYLATDTQLLAGELDDEGQVGGLETLLDDLPDAGQHPNRTLAFGPDGLLYLSVGSTCNACAETNPEAATVLQVEPDGSARTVFASGLRNTIGFGFHPETGELWGMDHGTDWRGDDSPPEELNRLEEGRNYGWPYCYGFQAADNLFNQEPPGMGKEQYCAELTTGPVLTYTAHSAPIGMVFYTGAQFPTDYANGAFIAMRGSWNRQPPTGYKVVFLRFADGEPVGFADFLSGFLLPDVPAHFGRLAGLLVAQDGSLLVGDDTNGVLYRVTYTGE